MGVGQEMDKERHGLPLFCGVSFAYHSPLVSLPAGLPAGKIECAVLVGYIRKL